MKKKKDGLWVSLKREKKKKKTKSSCLALFSQRQEVQTVQLWSYI